MIFLIIHVKFPGWTKDKNQGFAILMSPLKHHKNYVEKNRSFWAPFMVMYSKPPKDRTWTSQSRFLMKHEILVKVQVNSEFRFQWFRGLFLLVKMLWHWTKYLHLKCNGRSGEVLILVCKGNLLQTCNKAWICSNFAKYIDVKRVALAKL